MNVLDDNLVGLSVNVNQDSPQKFNITINKYFDNNQIKNFKFFIVIERGFWRDEHQIFITNTTEEQHNFEIISEKIKNDEGSVRFYATEDINGIPLKRLFSKKIKLGFIGGSSTDSLLNIRLVDSLSDLLYFVDIENDEPVLLIHQEGEQRYAENHIIGDELFKAGMLPDILSDIFYIVTTRTEEVNSEIIDKWNEFFDNISKIANTQLNDTVTREDAKLAIGKFLTEFKYRENFIKKILGEYSEQ